MCTVVDGVGLDWDPNATAWAKLLAQLVVFKEKSGGCTAVPRNWGKKNQAEFGIN